MVAFWFRSTCQLNCLLCRWAGLTASDPSQGTAIASVMKQFTDEGIEVWLRFGHEG